MRVLAYRSYLSSEKYAKNLFGGKTLPTPVRPEFRLERYINRPCQFREDYRAYHFQSSRRFILHKVYSPLNQRQLSRERVDDCLGLARIQDAEPPQLIARPPDCKRIRNVKI